VSENTATISVEREPGVDTTWNIEKLVEDLRLSREVLHNVRHRGKARQLPSREVLVQILEGLTAVLFPTHYGQAGFDEEGTDRFVATTLSQTLIALSEQVRRGLAVSREEDAKHDDGRLQSEAVRLTRAFASELPQIRALLVGDLLAAYEGDPAATNYPEILLGYPGMTAIIYYRLAHALYRLGAHLPARLISNLAHSKTGIDIHPGARIGESFFIDHGTGVVIGETAVVGDRVRIYQAVTLGAKSFPKDGRGALVKGLPRHPIVEDDVVIYAGATILGRITIGSGSVIGGNVWLTKNVPRGSNISQADVAAA
jgi:serine O-acetyltransferase